MAMTVLIPALEPDERLIELIRDIQEKSSFNILIIDDGSGQNYDGIFSKAEGMGCKVIRYMPNMGKGYAMKTGFQSLIDSGNTEGVICADSDGQHTIGDILKVAEKIKDGESRIILGSRKFVGDVPFKSLFGNKLTAFNFYLSTGVKINDTQTGLRGYNADMLPWLTSIKGNRYEYELNILLEAKKSGYSLHEVMIDTIYIENNKSSHFRPIIDSVRIYRQLIKFSLSSIIAAGIDFLILIVMEYLTNNLFISVVAARVISSTFNFLINKKYVFDDNSNRALESAIRYFSLVVIILALNYCLMYLLTDILNIYLAVAKLITELVLFTVSYKVQQLMIFSRSDNRFINNNRNLGT